MRFPSIVRACAATLTLMLNGTSAALEAGQGSPNCALTSVTGQQHYNLHQFRGKVLYVDFWASWCPPCAESFPFMNKLHHELQDRGLQVVAINLDEKSDEGYGFLARHPAEFTVAFDGGGKCPQDFGVKAMPSTYLIDRKGVVRHVHLGFRPGEAEQLRTLVERMLAERPAGQK